MGTETNYGFPRENGTHTDKNGPQLYTYIYTKSRGPDPPRVRVWPARLVYTSLLMIFGHIFRHSNDFTASLSATAAAGPGTVICKERRVRKSQYFPNEDTRSRRRKHS